MAAADRVARASHMVDPKTGIQRTQRINGEPTAALDSVRGRQVMELFWRIATERRAAIVVVTHDRRSEELFDGRIAEAPGLCLTEASLVG
jgi:ABC-type lipoprotein export system ATPase subunit